MILLAACTSDSDGDAGCTGNCAEPAGIVTVDAGQDFSVFERDEVTLIGVASHSENSPLRYEWTQVRGTVVEIFSADQPTATFIAPILATQNQDLGFLLSVTAEDGTTGSDTVDIRVELATGDSPPLPFSQVDRLAAWKNLPLETENNDTRLNATVLRFPQGSGAHGMRSAARGSLRSHDDSQDVFVFSVPFTGTYAFRFCAGPLVCEAGSTSRSTRMALTDDRSGMLATAAPGTRQEFEVLLDAGLAYFLDIGARDLPASDDDYAVIISGEASN